MRPATSTLRRPVQPFGFESRVELHASSSIAHGHLYGAFDVLGIDRLDVNVPFDFMVPVPHSMRNSILLLDEASTVR